MFDEKNVLTKSIERAPLISIFAKNGYGKSSFLASINNPFVLDTEKKFKTKGKASIYEPKDFKDMVECLEYYANKKEVDFSAFCIDSLDWVEVSIHEKICVDYHASNINDEKVPALNWFKGNNIAANIFFSDIYPQLIAIREKHNIPVVIGAQAVPIEQKEADKPPYDMQDFRVQAKLAAKVSDLMEAKVYLQKREHIDQKGNIIPTEERYLVTTRTKGINAKNNLDLPNEVPISYSNGWNDFISAIGTCKPKN